MKRLKPQMQVVYTNDTSDELRQLQIENEKLSAVNFDLFIKLDEQKLQIQQYKEQLKDKTDNASKIQMMAAIQYQQDRAEQL